MKPSDSLGNCVQCHLSQFARCSRRSNIASRDMVQLVIDKIDEISDDLIWMKNVSHTVIHICDSHSHGNLFSVNS